MLKPGVPAKNVFHYVSSELVSAGYPPARALVGHCLGVVWHQEEPILTAAEERELKAGMVVCLEPEISDYCLQDEIFITDRGPILLSDRVATDEMLMIDV
jgi:methionine aminopeptidase